MSRNTFKSSRVFLILTLFAFLIQACEQNHDRVQDSEISTLVKKFSVFKPSHAALKITNTTNSVASFSLKLNGNPKYNLVEIAEDIRRMSSEYEGESLERKAWRFVRDNLKFNPAYSEDKWQHNPHLLLNSPGFGQCDGQSALLVRLWEKLGFEARVWSLTGHVVSEVKSNNKWQMFDAAYGVYYYNEDKQIASVQELSSKSFLIQHPIEIMPFSTTNDYYSQFARYNSSTANKYLTQGDNTISKWLCEGVAAIVPQMLLPARSSIIFPLNKEKDQFEIFHNSMFHKETCISYISVSIPKNVTGIVKLPFVFAGVEGDGIVQLNGKEVNIKNIQSDLSKVGFISDIKVIENCTGINLTYFINPSLFALKRTNELSIKIEDPKSIRIDTISNSVVQMNQEFSQNDNHFIRPDINDSVALRNCNHFINKKGSWQKMLKQLKTIEQLNDVIWVYYKTQDNLTLEEQTVNVLRVNDYITQLIELKSENEELIIEISKRSDLMYLINIIESNKIEAVIKFLQTIKTQLQRKKPE
jgi:hypothetical protein